MGAFIKPGGPLKSFSNRSIIPPVYSKPHIVLRQNYWRVSPQLRPYSETHSRWRMAYEFVSRANEQRKYERLAERAKRKNRREST
jgi:hypothetical protein